MISAQLSSHYKSTTLPTTDAIDAMMITVSLLLSFESLDPESPLQSSPSKLQASTLQLSSQLPLSIELLSQLLSHMQ
jgi:hypothetical protein